MQLFRSAIITDKLSRLLPSLQTELARIEETGKKLENEGREDLMKLKAEVSGWLDALYIQEKSRVVSTSHANPTSSFKFSFTDLRGVCPVCQDKKVHPFTPSWSALLHK